MDQPRYDAVFLDVDGTLLWVDLDVAGYVEDLEPYAANGRLTVEQARKPVWESLRRHIAENIEHRTDEELDAFRRENARIVARDLDVEAPDAVLAGVAERRILFNPYPESERVLRELRELGLKLYVVSNWDIRLETVLEDLGWTGYFEAVIASAVVGVEKPEGGIFEEALRVSGVPRDRVVHVGNDPVSDVRGAARAGLDVVFVDRKGAGPMPEATSAMPDLGGLPDFVSG